MIKKNLKNKYQYYWIRSSHTESNTIGCVTSIFEPDFVYDTLGFMPMCII